MNTRTGKEVTFEIADGIAKVNDTILDDLSSILVSFEISQATVHSNFGTVSGYTVSNQC